MRCNVPGARPSGRDRSRAPSPGRSGEGLPGRDRPRRGRRRRRRPCARTRRPRRARSAAGARCGTSSTRQRRARRLARVPAGDQGPLVQERGHLLPVRRHLHGRQRRRHRRLRGADAPPRLPARARHHRDLADAVPELARAGRRLRHLRLLRGEPGARDPGRLRRVHARGQAAGHPGDHRPGRQPHLGPAPVVPGGPARSSVPVPRLVRLVREEAGQRQYRHGVPRRAEVDLDLRQGSARVVLPPLLRFPARPQHVEPARPGRDPQDHGLLDPARRLRVPDGRGAVRDLHQGPEGAQAGGAVRDAALAARLSPVARRRLHHPGRGECSARDGHGVLRQGRRPHAHDVQLPGQPEPVLRAGLVGLAAARARAEGDDAPPRDRAVGALPAQPRRARPGPPERGAAPAGVQVLRPRGEHAALRARHPAPARADARAIADSSSSPTA